MILTLKTDFAPGFTARKEVVIEQVENFIGISEMFATFKDLRILCHLIYLKNISRIKWPEGKNLHMIKYEL